MAVRTATLLVLLMTFLLVILWMTSTSTHLNASLEPGSPDTRTSGESIHLNVSSEPGSPDMETRECTVDDLLPLALAENEALSSEWFVGGDVDPVYGCDCGYLRARYFCPHLGSDGYPTWVPRAVSDGKCHSVSSSLLAEAPLPPDFKVLVYGNSYMRQLVESMMCIVHEHVSTKKVKYYRIGPGKEGDRYASVKGDAQCRSCAPYDDELVEYGCLSESEARGEACTCSDGTSEYYFANGAILHYQFAGGQENKHVSKAPPHFDVSSVSYYDAVFANFGNSPSMEPPQVLSSAAELKNASVPFFWLSTYEGLNGEGGDVDGWEEDDRARMDSLGAKYIRVGVMALGLDHLRKGSVEPDARGDPHFCLPGPPDEIALLVLKIAWALYFERGGNQ